MMYEVELTEAAYNDIERLRKAGEFAAIRKIDALIYQLQKHPFTGTGKPEPLMGDKKRAVVPKNYWETSADLFS